MASSLNYLTSPSSSTSLYFLSLHSQTNHHNSNNYTRTLKFRTSCSHQIIQHETQQINFIKKKRKPRPSFFEQIQEKWCLKTISLREKFPWQEQEHGQKIEEEEEEEEEEVKSNVSDQVSFSSGNRSVSPPWVHGNKPKKTQFDYETRNSPNGSSQSETLDGFGENYKNELKNLENQANYSGNGEGESKIGRYSIDGSKPKIPQFDSETKKAQFDSETRNSPNGSNQSETLDGFGRNYKHELKNFENQANSCGNFEGDSTFGTHPMDRSKPKKPHFDSEARNSANGSNRSETTSGFRGNYKQEPKNLESQANYNGNGEGESKLGRHLIGLLEKKEENRVGANIGGSDLMRLPWKRESEVKTIDGERLKSSNTKLAEDTIPEFELKRLRNVALRMVERIKVGAAGVTQALVDSIHEQWKINEVVKLKFEGPPSLNMRRTHEILESRTGGLVIWRSGSSVVLYRGMTYKFSCVQSYTQQNQVNMNTSHSSEDYLADVSKTDGFKDLVRTMETLNPNAGRYLKDLSEDELKDLSELNHMLDKLGPRYKDWSGRDPLPVDADLLPALIPGYKRPFRLLPYGIRHGLRDKEMTFFRRSARTMPPHFALGRNRELEGLARAMVKLWERSAIAKIAIKRGVHNTCNERMAEELKILTGGTLVSRNKDYIVFYRGNDFLPPAVSGTLAEAQKLIALRQDGEEQARLNMSALIGSNPKATKSPLVAGTLAETMAATSHWGNQPSGEEREKMMRDLALARHASLVKYLENKLSVAKGKIKKAEKALHKVQEDLEPTELPTDLETLSEEERFLFRKIGLSMKPYLLLGRRGIFDGTIENMHLHWKYREVVKIIVARSSFFQVKQVAISLEAESGGVLVSLDKTTKGYAIIVYRGKNYQLPLAVRPRNLLSKRQALARSIELQRREALKHHISDLQEEIEKLKSELEEMKSVDEIDEETLNSRVDNASSADDDEMEEDEGEEAYLEMYDSGNEDGNV